MTEIIEVELTPEEIAEREAYESGAYDRAYAQVQEERRQGYILTADPLFFGWQRGENTEQDWLDAVQAVKDTHPYPEEG